MKKQILFIDRDGTILNEPPENYQIDKLNKFSFKENVISALYDIKKYTDYIYIMVTNQDGLGTDAFPEKDFWPFQNLMLQILKSVGFEFDDIFIDKSFEHEHLATRKPGTEMLKAYLSDNYDLANSLVIGDRQSDVELASNIGCRAIYLGKEKLKNDLQKICALQTENWIDIRDFVIAQNAYICKNRQTAETNIKIEIFPQSPQLANINTGIGFFDHLLSQLVTHGGFGIRLFCEGDLYVDQHHTIEDTAIVLGLAFNELWNRRKYITRYAFVLPMDDSLTHLAIDFGGRPDLQWDVEFKNTMIGDYPTEMFYHFFKSFCDNAKCNLNIKADGKNEHHKIESIFKAFARCLKQATNVDLQQRTFPSSKGVS